MRWTWWLAVACSPHSSGAALIGRGGHGTGRGHAAAAVCVRRPRLALMVEAGGDRGAGVAGQGDLVEMQQTTDITKTQFGGGSGGTATLDDSDFSVNTILKQLESIQQGTPKNIVILGTRHCSFLHQQIIELLSYALVLSDNHIYTSGATGTHAAAVRGALRADNPELLTVILPQSLARQPREIRDLLGQVRTRRRRERSGLALGSR